MALWTVRATGVANQSEIDADEVRRALSVLADPAHGIELRALPSARYAVLKAADVPAVVQAAERLGDEAGLYYTLNPIPASLPHRARVGDVLSRRWLLLDIDPVKAEGHKDDSATDAEKEAARACCEQATDWLTEQGWPCPVLIDSGNGFHALYRIDLPVTPHTHALVKACVYELADKFDAAGATVDRSVHNASRVAKLPGSVARKGKSTADRPHRRVMLLHVPAESVLVTAEMIAGLFGGRVESNGTNGETHAPANGAPWEVRARQVGQDDGGRAYARAALDRELARVRLAAPGGRNVALNRAGFSMAQLAAGGCILWNECDAALWQAAVAAGLGEREVRATLRSAYEAGGKQPRRPPERPGSPNALAREQAREELAGEALTVCAASIKPLKVPWLYSMRIPKRFLTVFAGQTGLGKSFITCDIIARMTTGREMPCSNGECFEVGNALIISEDPYEYMLAPRLIELGADMGRIRFMTWKAMASYTLADTEMLVRACAETGEPKLVMIDPPTNFLGEADEHRNAEIRVVLMRMVEWVQSIDAACVLIMHVNKMVGKGIGAINRVLGSVAWISTARIAHTFAADPDDEKKGLFVPMKNNLGPKAKGLSYQIVGTRDDLAVVEWFGEVDTTADDAMNQLSKRVRRDVVAAEWLVDRFKEKLEWVSDELFKAASAAGVSRNAIFEAKKKLELPKARKRTLENGNVEYVWWVPPSWPRLQPTFGTTGTPGTPVAAQGLTAVPVPGHQDGSGETGTTEEAF